MQTIAAQAAPIACEVCARKTANKGLEDEPERWDIADRSGHFGICARDRRPRRKDLRIRSKARRIPAGN